MTAVADEATADAGPAPETTAPGAGPVTGEDPEIGLTDEDLRVIAMAHAQIFKACSLASSRMLARERPAALQAVTDAEAELAEARSELEDPQAVVDRLRAELDECRRRGQEVQLAADDKSLTVRLEARSLKVAITEETAAIEERVRRATRVTDPLIVTVTAAERKVRALKNLLTRLDEAIAFPFTSELGKATEPYRQYLLGTGTWYSSRSQDARELVMKHLRSTNLGHELQVQAIQAYLAGHPDALAVGGNVKRFADGTTITHPANGPDIVTGAQPTPESLAAVPGVPQTPGPSGAEVMGGLRSGAGWPQPAPQNVTKAAPRRGAIGWGLEELLDAASR